MGTESDKQEEGLYEPEEGCETYSFIKIACQDDKAFLNHVMEKLGSN